jgi:N-methylhydantoinase B/oxoprolinase/acetone carboxylase alpha subunit
VSVISVSSNNARSVDPVTFEVLSHRLWSINDEQAMIAARVSGSPAIYEAYDFNCALLTPDGQGLFSGMYIIHHAVPIDILVRKILDQWPLDEIREGDMFFTNDPWSGALHANDGILVSPIFDAGEIVCWTGIVMHEQDVGGPVPGSSAPGAKDRYGEAPIFTPIKMVENYQFRRDIEAAFLCNHRTPELNALNLRARLAALTITHRRIHELIGEYGRDTFLALQGDILDYVEQVVRDRVRKIPDGVWEANTHLDHGEHEIYEIRCALSKRGDSLKLDFAGTSPQAAAPLNCAYSGLMGGCFGNFLLSMFFDVPWTVGAATRILTIEAEEGTIINATSPAPVSLASVMGTWAVQDVVGEAFGKMLMASEELWDEAQATWNPGINATIVASVDANGAPLVAPLMECMAGGAGARAFADGLDTGGLQQSLSSTLPNVETMEERLPLLYVYRKERMDSCGHGRYRGGLGLEYAVVPHKNLNPIEQVTHGSAVSQPAAHGLSGGTPAPLQSSVLLRDAALAAIFARGEVPQAEEEIEASETEVLSAQAVTPVGDDDCRVSLVTGGGGYGDPLLRDPGSVETDVRRSRISAPIAREVYGVLIDESGARDDVASEGAREQIRAERLRTARPVSASKRARLEGAEVLHRVADTVDAVIHDGDRALRCSECEERLAGYGEDYKLGCYVRELSLSELSPLNARGDDGRMVARQFVCPGCGTAVALDIQEREKPLMLGSYLVQQVVE